MWTLISARIYFFNSFAFHLQALAQQITLENMQDGPQVQLSMSLLFQKRKDSGVQSRSLGACIELNEVELVWKVSERSHFKH